MKKVVKRRRGKVIKKRKDAQLKAATLSLAAKSKYKTILSLSKIIFMKKKKKIYQLINETGDLLRFVACCY